MKFPKEDFTIGIYTHKAVNDPFHADILALVREKGKLGMEELECLYTPVDEIVAPKGFIHCSGAKQIEQHLKQRRQSVPPFRIFLQSEDAEMLFQSEEHFEQGKHDRYLHIYPRRAEAMATLKQLQGLTLEIAGETLGSRQLAVHEQLSDNFKGQYDIRISASQVFLRHISRDIDALNIWDDIRGILHGEKIPREWPCRKDAYVEFQLTSISSGLFYSIAIETRNVLTAGNKRARREWGVSERIWNSNFTDAPVFRSDDEASILNGKEVIPERGKSRLAECQHPFAKEILAL